MLTDFVTLSLVISKGILAACFTIGVFGALALRMRYDL